MNFQSHTKSIIKTAKKISALIKVAPLAPLMTDFNEKVVFISFIKGQFHYRPLIWSGKPKNKQGIEYKAFYKALKISLFRKDSTSHLNQQLEIIIKTSHITPVGIYLLKVNIRNSRTRCEFWFKVNNMLTLNIFHTLFLYFYC